VTSGGTLPLPADGKGPRAGAAGACLYVVLHADRPLESGARCSLANVDEVEIVRAGNRRISRAGRRLTVELPDLWVSSRHATLGKVLGSWAIEDLQSRNGTRVNGATIDRSPLADGDVIEVGQTFLLFRDGVSGEERPAEDFGEPRTLAPGLATLSPTLAARGERLQAIAASKVPVLVLGETGTGKELMASAVHALSGRAGPFQAVNCGALPANLVESELFGFRKGAFSGATEDRQGLIRAAARGTLFLDEIGDLPAPAQAALLRALQEGEVLPIGATQPVPVDFRLVSATHRKLDELVKHDKFRADLMARISGFTLELPALRERREDIGLIVAQLLRRHLGERAANVTFAAEAVRALLRYDWPLNIRELERSLQAAVALAGAASVQLAHLPDPIARMPDQARQPIPPAAPAVLSDRDQALRDSVVAALKASNGNIAAAARTLGKARVQVQRWIKRFGIDVKELRASS
jgi:transcriptional regulator with GAF, ATPase, and Fis domain